MGCSIIGSAAACRASRRAAPPAGRPVERRAGRLASVSAPAGLCAPSSSRSGCPPAADESTAAVPAQRVRGQALDARRKAPASKPAIRSAKQSRRRRSATRALWSLVPPAERRPQLFVAARGATFERDPRRRDSATSRTAASSRRSAANRARGRSVAGPSSACWRTTPLISGRPVSRCRPFPQRCVATSAPASSYGRDRC